jgi:hypothetical protein
MQVTKKIRTIVASMVMVVGLVFALGAPVGAQSEFLPYCKRPIQRPCLQHLKVDISTRCSTEPAGGLIDIEITNPNRTNAPRVITVFLDGEPFFEDSGFAEPGTKTTTFGPLPNGAWAIAVSWEGLVFGRERTPLTCVPPNQQGPIIDRAIGLPRSESAKSTYGG